MTQQDKDEIVRLLTIRWKRAISPELTQGVYDCIEIVQAMPISTDDTSRMRAALEEIAKGRGPFKRDPLEFASACLGHAVETAKAALEASGIQRDS